MLSDSKVTGQQLTKLQLAPELLPGMLAAPACPHSSQGQEAQTRARLLSPLPGELNAAPDLSSVQNPRSSLAIPATRCHLWPYKRSEACPLLECVILATVVLLGLHAPLLTRNRTEGVSPLLFIAALFTVAQSESKAGPIVRGCVNDVCGQ